jgi:N-acetylglucosaminyldiphosphoundecaprenol N-acetyl-beta-D-mannosaminyltransferase
MNAQPLDNPAETPLLAKQRVSIFNYPVDVVTPNAALQLAVQAVNQQQTLQVVTLNPEMLMQGDIDPQLGYILKNAGLVLPDGAGLVWALKRQGHTHVNRLPGIEFSENLLAYAAQHHWKVAIIGASPDIHTAALDKLKQRFVGLNLVYTHHGFFDDPAAIAHACADTQPQVILVALGVPRQEIFLADTLLPLIQGHMQNRNTGCIGVGIGGSLDVWSGQKRRAPQLMRTFNMEWLYRITSEPWRIQRIAKTLPAFVVRVLSSKA